MNEIISILGTIMFIILFRYISWLQFILIGIVSKKNSILYKSSDIKLFIPEVKEAGLGIVPTSSTTSQIALGDALAISSMKHKKFGKMDFKKFHPAGSLGAKLKTVEDLMLIGKKIPFVREKMKMKKALSIITKKKLGVLIVQNKKGLTKGIITDGQIRRTNLNNPNLQNLIVQKVMTKNPINIDRNELAAKALSIMNSKKITSLCVFDKKNKNKTIGILHIHNILNSNVS